MTPNKVFFERFWPRVAVQVTESRPQTGADILPLLRRLRIPHGASVLDVPCGYGRHSVLLARHGYRVTGVDIGRTVLAEARRRAGVAHVSVDWRRGDMRKLPFRGTFDLVLNLFTSFGYFGDEQDARVLRQFHGALRPSGWVVLQMINRDWILRHYRPRRQGRIGGGFTLEETATLDLTTSFIRTAWIARKGGQTWRGTTNLRVYSPHELVHMLRAAGFRRISAQGSFTGKPLTFHQQWQLVVGQKPRA
jgi:SAM-dependent methyltransferase